MSQFDTATKESPQRTTSQVVKVLPSKTHTEQQTTVPAAPQASITHEGASRSSASPAQNAVSEAPYSKSALSSSNLASPTVGSFRLK